MVKKKASKKSKKKRIIMGIIAIIIGSIIIYGIYTPLPPDFDNPPKFCTTDFTEINKIYEISKFRSFAGHDYSDSFESQRSMKHYFAPKDEFGNSSVKVKVFSPVDGVIDYIWDEQHVLPNGEIQGKQVGIRVNGHTDFVVVIFHMNKFANITVGMPVKSGQQLGFADTRFSHDFDIAIKRNIGLFKLRLYSYFQVMTDELFAKYQQYGITSRDMMIKPKELVDSLTPDWNNYHRDDWVILNATSGLLNSVSHTNLNLSGTATNIPKALFQIPILHSTLITVPK